MSGTLAPLTSYFMQNKIITVVVFIIIQKKAAKLKATK
jgi:hypothetical protein